MENEDCEILWAMSQETLRNPTAISTLPSLMHKPSVRSLLSIPGGAIPEWRHDFNKQLPVLEKKYRTILRATQFRSTLNQFWIPEHGVEFFTSFLLDIQDRWELLFKAAKLHLVESVGPASPPSKSRI